MADLKKLELLKTARAVRKQSHPDDVLEDLRDALGGEPLEGSGFEDETPEPGFADTDQDAGRD